MAECPVNKACDQIYRSRYPTTPPDSRTSYYSTEDDPSHSEEVDYDGVNDHLPNSGYYDSSYNNLTREPDEYDCDNYEPNHSTSEDEEKCEPDTDSVTEEDADTGDEEEDYQYEDERDNYDYGDQEEDGEGYVCPTCGTHSQPDERDKFRGEDLHGRSDEYIRYINEMCEGSEFHVDAYIKRRNYAMCGGVNDHLPDACDEDIDEEDNFCFLYKCGAYYPGHFACNFAAESEAECVSHLREIHSTSKELYKLYKRIA